MATDDELAKTAGPDELAATAAPSRGEAIAKALGSVVGDAKTLAGGSMLADTAIGGPDPKSLDQTAETLHEPAERRSNRMLHGWKKGDTIGRFVVLQALGAGGMGIVLSAYDPQLDRKVAIKIVRPELAGGSPGTNAVRTRLEREAQAMAKLNHPNVITVYDVGTLNNDVFIAMEYVDGGTLGAWLKREELAWHERLALVVKAGRGLAAAHAAGLIHRDFKPDNVLVGTDGRVRVTDFGLVGSTDKQVEPLTETLPASSLDKSAPMLQQLTRTGVIMGTPAYMAPEQFDGANVDARADQFAFCVTAYEALTGQRPFEGQTYPELMESVKAGRVIPWKGYAPVMIKCAILKGLSVDPKDRYASMDALLAELSRDVFRVRRIGIVAALFVTAIAVAVIVMRSRTASGPPPCKASAERMAGVWDEATKTRLQRAFTGAAPELATESFTRVASALDDYAKRWVAGHTDACEATHVRREQSAQDLDLRMHCLERRRSELAALTTVLGKPDREIVAKAPQSTFTLIPPEPCADRTALAAAYPPPTAAQAPRVTELRGKLADASAQHATGKYTAALPAANDVLAQARQVDYPPLIAETLNLVGWLQRDLRAAKAAEPVFIELARAAGRARDDKLLARTWTELVFVVGYLQGRPAEALIFEHPARAALERIGGGDARMRARLENNLGLTYTKLGKADDGRPYHERAITILEKEVGADHPDIATSYQNLAVNFHHSGKPEDSIRYSDKAIAIMTKSLGPDHPTVLGTTGNKALALAVLDRLEESLALNKRVLAGLEKVVGLEAPQITINLINTAGIHHTLEQFDKAIELYARALANVEKVGVENPLGASALVGYGEALADAGRCDDARKHLERGIAILEKLTSDKPVLADALRSLAICDRRENKLADARAKLDRAVSASESAGKESAVIADELQARGELALLEKRFVDARADFDRALAIREKVHGTNAYFLARPLRGIGGIYLAQNKPAEAVPFLERALAIEKAKGTPNGIARTEALLAQAQR